MSVRFLLTVGAVLLLLCGCRQDPRMQVYLDNVNAEKRMLEDTLYDLQYDYESKLKEVEKLRGELSRLQANGTGSSATGSPAKVKSPSASGGDLFPNIPDLKPPTVEPGTRANATVTPDKQKVPSQESPPELEDTDDLVPPKLELPEEPDAGSTEAEPAAKVSAGTEPAETEPADPGAMHATTPSSKLASRWTPRSVRRPDPPRRRVTDANPADTNSSTVESTGTDPAADRATNGLQSGPSSADAVSKQANRPAWRPYR